MKLQTLYDAGLIMIRVLDSCQRVGITTLQQFVENADLCSNCRNMSPTIYHRTIEQLEDVKVITFVPLFVPLLDFPKTIAEQFDQETREHATNTLVDALLASCDTHEERIELSVNLLGYDPR